jgi:hypothetical protein
MSDPTKGANPKKQLQRTHSERLSTKHTPAWPEEPCQLKRTKSENLNLFKRRLSSFREGGSKYQNKEMSTRMPRRTGSRQIFADELGSELEEVRSCTECAAKRLLLQSFFSNPLPPPLQAHTLEQSYYKPLPGQAIQAHELMDYSIEIESDCSAEWGEDPVLKVVPVHLFGTIILVGNAVQFNQQHSEAIARVLRASNENGEQSFQPKQLKKAPMRGFEKLIWKCNFKVPATHVMEDLRACPELSGFDIELLGHQPMDFIATDNNILNLVNQLHSQGRSVPADHFFCSEGRTLEDLMEASKS